MHLEKAGILNLLNKSSKGLSSFQKPDKIYLENTNLAYALKYHPEIGTLRETFFLNQLKNSGHRIQFPQQGDFLVDGKLIFEVGGKGKDNTQIVGIKNSFIAADDIEIGYKNKIPLWLFGFLY